MSIKFADISEHQSTFDANGYLNAGTKVIICRTHSGYRQDKALPSRMTQIRSTGFVCVGWYQYLAADRDAAAQAREYIATIGQLKANEFAIVDIEEGSGNQAPRADAWFAVVDPWAKTKATLYSGASFLNDRLGGTGRYGNRPLWIASYPNSYSANTALYPKGATFWQYSDRERFTGLSGAVDGNYYANSAAELLTAVKGKAAPAPAPTPTPAEDDMANITSVVKNNGDIVTFVIDNDGVVWRRAQANGKWQDTWTRMGKPGSTAAKK
jgi:GH25 family lysozyme M1 (1,4-beta-N-acetylmuramidase)